MPSSTRCRPRRSGPSPSCASTARCASAPAPAATPTCTTADRASPPASGSSTPVFMLDAVRQALADADNTGAPADPAYFAGAGLDAPDLHEAAAEERERRHEQRQRQADAVRTNLGLGHDLRAGLIDPSPAQLDALRAIVCHLLARDYRDVIAYGAGWTDPERQRPVGESARYEPQAMDTIVDAELRRALEEPDPLRGIAGLVARCAAAFVLDPDGVTRTKVLGSERMSR